MAKNDPWAVVSESSYAPQKSAWDVVSEEPYEPKPYRPAQDSQAASADYEKSKPQKEVYYDPMTGAALGEIDALDPRSIDDRRTRSNGRLTNKDIPEQTATSLGRDVASGVAQIVPTALGGLGEVSRLVTGDTFGKGLTEPMDKANKWIQENVGSERGIIQRKMFAQDMQDKALSPADVVLGNGGALSDQILPTIGSMALPIGVAGAAGKIATGTNAAKLAAAIDEATVLARANKVRETAAIGTTVAQNAGNTYSELRDKGLSQEDAYKGAAVAGAGTLIAGKLAGGGAEARAAGLLSGAEKSAISAIPKGIVKEGFQEGAEELSQYTGEVVGEKKDFDTSEAGKRIAVAATLGGVMGGGVDVAGAAATKFVSFANPDGPASQAGITPVTIPTAPNVSTPSASTGVSTGAADGGGNLAIPSVGDTGLAPTVGRGLGGTAGGDVANVTEGGAVSQQSVQPTASVNPIARSSDSDLLGRLPTEVEPITVLAGADGTGLSQGDAKLQQEAWSKRHGGAEWKIEPLANGKFRVAGYQINDAANVQNTTPDSIPLVNSGVPPKAGDTQAAPTQAAASGAGQSAAVAGLPRAGDSQVQPAGVGTPATIWTGRSGAGYETVEAANQALETRTRKDPEMSWKVEQRPDGKYHLAGYAQPTTREQAVAEQQRLGVADQTDVVDTAELGGEGFAVAPQLQKETVGELRKQQSSVEQLAAAIGSTGADASGIEIVTPKSIKTPAQFGAAAIVKRVAAVAKTAFGLDTISIRGVGALGVAHNGKVYANIDEIAAGGQNSMVALAIGTIGHEAGHSGLERSKDPEDRKAYANLKELLRGYYQDGVVDKQLAFENASAAKDGSGQVTRDYAENEVIQNINGAMWLDPKFWGRMHDIDNGSTMRRVAYRFMQAATKMIEAAKGTDLDIDTLVKNRDAVRKIVAKTWAEKAMRQGKVPMSRTQIAKMLDTPPTDAVSDAAFKRKGVIGEVAPNPDQAVAAEFDAMQGSEKEMATRDIAKKIVQKLFDDMQLRGWSVAFSSGTFEGKENPNFVIEAADGATSAQIDEVTRALGYVLDQKAMVSFDESNTTDGNQSSFVKIELPSGISAARVSELRKHINEKTGLSGDTLRGGALVFGNFTGYSDKPLADEQFRDALKDAITSSPDEGSFVIKDVERFESNYIEPANKEGYLEGTRYGNSDRGREDRPQQGGVDIRRGQGRDFLERLSQEAGDKLRQWIDSSASGRERVKRNRELDAEERAAADSKRSGAVEYGKAGPNSVQAVGRHYSKEQRKSLSSAFYGSGLRGAESDRLNGSQNSDIRSRIYFYVDSGNGVKPEAGVGGKEHIVKLNNLYDANKDPLGIWKNSKGETVSDRLNNQERTVMRAGFDGYLADTGATQKFAVLIGKHDIPLFKRRTKPVEDYNDIGNINELENFNLDADYANSTKDDFSFPDLSAADAKLDAAKLTEQEQKQREMDKADEEQRLQRELAMELEESGFDIVGPAKNASVKEKSFSDVKPAEIKAAGLLAESAYPELSYSEDPSDPSAERAFFVVNGVRYRVSASDSFPRMDTSVFGEFAKKGSKGIVSGSGLAGMSKQGKKDWNKRFAASADLIRRNFDIFTSVSAKARDNVLATWKAIAENPDAFEFGKADDAKGKNAKELAQDIANKMMAGSRYKVEIGSPEYRLGDGDFGIVITDTKTGKIGNADVEFWVREKELTMHTQKLDLGSGLGKPVYQIGQAFADKFKARINADGMLLGVNNYRRTEQMFSGMLRSGNYETMQPGVGQRIYGWNERAKTQEQKDRNMVRTALAATRNVLEFAPEMKDIGFDLKTNKFFFKNKPDSMENRLMAGVEIRKILSNSDARMVSISRSTLARAAITLGAIDGDVVDATNIAEPVLYKRKQRQLDERTDVQPMLDDLGRSLKSQTPASIDKVMSRIADWRKSLDSINEASFQDELIDVGSRAIDVALAAGVKESDSRSSPVPIGATPHVLRMLGFDMSPLRVDSRVVGKILNGKHSADFVGVTAKEFVNAIYNPVLVTKLQAKDEVEIVTSLTSPEDGLPVVFMVKRGAVFQGQRGENGAPMKPLVTHALMSAYSKPSFWTVHLRSAMKSGSLLYANVGELQSLESKNPALGGVLSSVGASQYPDTLKAKPVSADTASLPPSSDGESLRSERANVSIGSTQSGLVAPSASRLTKDIAKSVMAGNVKGYGDLVNFVSQNYNGDGDQMPTFKRKQPPRAPGLPGESRFMAVRRKLQDQYIQIRELQDMLTARGGVVGEAQDVYRAEERMHGRAQELLTDFSRNQIEPFVAKAAKMGVSLDEIALYAYAKHAEERNAYIKSINPKIGDAGSGMSDAHAQNIIQMVKLAGDDQKFDELHNELMGITATTRRVMLDEGLITQEEYDGWEGLYENYVPLRGFEDVNHETATPLRGTGRGFSMTGKESVKALGRTSKAGDILENILRDYERAVIRSEKNAVAKTFLDLAISNPDPALWEIAPVKTNRSFNKASGMVLMTNTPDTGDETIAIKVSGQQVRVKINDPLILRAMKQASKDETSQLERLLANTLGAYTNLMRNTLTRYNPIFGFINAFRDAQMGAVSAYDELGAEGAKLYAKYLPVALAASFRQERNKANPNGTMDKWIQEMRFAGGTTGGYHMRETSEITEAMRTLMLQAGATPNTSGEKVRASLAYQKAAAAMKWMEIIGSTSEDAARVAAYRAAREMGKTPAQAASISKNLTTNFNRKGEWGNTLNSLYLFFNAGVQGTARVLEALSSRRVQYLMAGVTAASMTLALINAGQGDDDDGQNYWDKIPDFEKERNFIFMLPPGVEMDGASKVGTRGRYIKIPMPYGLNVFPVLGNQIADLARYAKDPSQGVKPAKAAINMVSAVFGSINPFGGATDPTDFRQLAMAVSPTASDLGLQLGLGINAFGRPVGPEKSPFDDKPDSENFSARQAGTASQHVARWINSVTGGNEGRSGKIDVMPGTIDNLVRNTTGGLGVFLADTFVNLPTKIASPVETTNRDVPLVRNFFGQIDEVTDVGLFYDRREKMTKEMKAAQAEMKLGIEVDYTQESQTMQTLGKAAEGYTKWMSALRKEEIAIAADDTLTKGDKMLKRRELEKQRGELAKSFNSMYNEEMKALK